MLTHPRGQWSMLSIGTLPIFRLAVKLYIFESE